MFKLTPVQRAELRRLERELKDANEAGWKACAQTEAAKAEGKQKLIEHLETENAELCAKCRSLEQEQDVLRLKLAEAERKCNAFREERRGGLCDGLHHG